MASARVLVMPSWYPSAANPAAGVFIEDQVAALSRQYEVGVYVLEPFGCRALAQGRPRRPLRVERRPRSTVYRYSAFTPPRILGAQSSGWYYRAARRGYRRVLHDWGRPDLIHAHVVLPVGWIAMRLGREFRVPVVLTEHTGPFDLHLLTRRNRRRVAATFNRTPRVVAVSPALATQITRRFPAVHPRVLGNVVPTEIFACVPRPSRAGAPVRFLSVALWKPEKGGEELLRAAALLRDRGHHAFELLLGGEGPDRPRLESLCTQLGLTGHVTFLGLLAREQVAEWMGRSDVFVLPSHGETFGMVVAEAMACGTPVIATRCGGPEWILSSGPGWLVPPRAVPPLADAMESALCRDALPDAAAVRATIEERFGPKAFLRGIEALYGELLGNRPGAAGGER